jgi:hypothetical protein
MIKSILLKLDLQGEGIVNYDSGEQKWIFNKKDSLRHMFHNHENVSYAKKNFYTDENGVWSYKIKISSDCIKHNIFNDDLIAQSPAIVHHDHILYPYIGSTLSLIRGYLFAEKTGSFKKTGSLQLCDAEQTNNAVSKLEFFCKSGGKTTNEGDTDKSDNTIFNKETIGEITYSSKGFIDLKELQFVSCDQIFDRYSFNPDKFDIYKKCLSKCLPNFNSELGYYKFKTSFVDIPEYGILLSSENVLYLVKETLKRILKLNIRNKNAYAKLNSLKIKLVQNVFVDTMESEDNWLEIKTLEDIDNLNFEPELFYILENEEDANAKRSEIEDCKKAKKEKKEKK